MSSHAPTEIQLGKRHIEDDFVAKVKGAAVKVLVISLLATGLCMLFPSMRERFFQSFLVAATFYLSIALGALWFVLVHHCTKAGWSVVVRRVAEGISMNTTWIWVLFLVFAIPGLGHWTKLYPWPVHFGEGYEGTAAAETAAEHGEPGAHGEAAAHGGAAAAPGHAPSPYDSAYTVHAEPSAAKAKWLSGGWFTGRMVLYFLIWIGSSFFFFKKSLEQDASGDVKLTDVMQNVGPAALILFSITCFLAGFDLLMALEPAWFSTIFGLYFFAGCVVSFFASLILFLYLFQRAGLIKEVNSEHYQDVGKLMFAFIIFWAYIAYSQFMLQWYGNIPEETIWYVERIDGGWMLVAVWILVGHFFVPFFLLMSRWPKRRPHLLALGALWVLGMHYVDLFWLVLPSSHALARTQVPVPVLDAALCLGLGAAFVLITVNILKGKSLIPEKDPRLGESLAFENF